MRSKHLIVSIVLAAGMMMLAATNARQQRGATQSGGILPADTTKMQDRHPEVEFDMSCYECHLQVTPKAAQQWHESTHGKVNIGCYICHGDGEEEFHKQPPAAVCATCHAAQQVNFSKAEASSCFTCHQGHTLKFHWE